MLPLCETVVQITKVINVMSFVWCGLRTDESIFFCGKMKWLCGWSAASGESANGDFQNVFVQKTTRNCRVRLDPQIGCIFKRTVCIYILPKRMCVSNYGSTPHSSWCMCNCLCLCVGSRKMNCNIELFFCFIHIFSECLPLQSTAKSNIRFANAYGHREFRQCAIQNP